MISHDSECLTALLKFLLEEVGNGLHFKLRCSFGISQVKCLRWCQCFGIVKIGGDTVGKYLENILSFSQAAKCISK